MVRKSQIEFRCRLFRGWLGQARLSRQQSLDVPVPRYLVAQPLAQSEDWRRTNSVQLLAELSAQSQDDR